MARKRGKRSIISIGEELGLSPATVSRVINNHPGISRRTRQSVLDALRILGYKSEILSLIQPQHEKYEFSVTLLMCPLPEQRDPFALEYFSILADGVRDGLAGENVKFQLRTLRAGTEEPPEFEAERDSVILVGYPSEGLRRNLREAGIDYLITSGDIYSDTEDMDSNGSDFCSTRTTCRGMPGFRSNCSVTDCRCGNRISGCVPTRI